MKTLDFSNIFFQGALFIGNSQLKCKCKCKYECPPVNKSDQFKLKKGGNFPFAAFFRCFEIASLQVCSDYQMFALISIVFALYIFPLPLPSTAEPYLIRSGR